MTTNQGTIHRYSGAGIVRCGLPMFDARKNTLADVEAGRVWDMSTASTGETWRGAKPVSCQNCLRGRRAAR